jgi:hypothetical protein
MGRRCVTNTEDILSANPSPTKEYSMIPQYLCEVDWGAIGTRVEAIARIAKGAGHESMDAVSCWFSLKWKEDGPRG